MKKIIGILSIALGLFFALALGIFVNDKYDNNFEHTSIVIDSNSGHTHTMVKQDGQEPTCTQNGFKEHYRCSTCNKYYEDEEGKIAITTTISTWKSNAGKLAAHHNVEKVDGKAPTTKEDGWKDHFKCTKCNKLFVDENATIEITKFNVWKVNGGLLPKLASNINLGLILGIAFGSLGVLLVILVILYILWKLNVIKFFDRLFSKIDKVFNKKN